MLKKLLFFLLLVFGIYSDPKPVSFGILIDNIYDIDWHTNTANIGFTIWNIFDHPVSDPEGTFSLENAVSETVISKSVDQISENAWVSTVKYKAVLYQNFHMRNFPFAEEDIVIEIACNEPIDTVVYDLDTNNSAIANNARVANWKVLNFSLDKSQTKYGFSIAKLHEKATDTYDKVTVNIKLERGGWKLFFELFAITYIGFVLASTVFFLRTTDVSAKSNLILAALFAVVGSKLSLDNYLPLTDDLTYTDWLIIISLIYVAVVLILSIITLPRNQTEEERRKAIKIDHKLGILLPSIFIAVNIFLILTHYSSR